MDSEFLVSQISLCQLSKRTTSALGFSKTRIIFTVLAERVEWNDMGLDKPNHNSCSPNTLYENNNGTSAQFETIWSLVILQSSINHSKEWKNWISQSLNYKISLFDLSRSLVGNFIGETHAISILVISAPIRCQWEVCNWILWRKYYLMFLTNG